ncbi:MAG: DUF4349 domain-containing protein [Chloroflexi bacterium]|nr:DUF4349 domain-containing protein [Chloroflexota bacterium]
MTRKLILPLMAVVALVVVACAPATTPAPASVVREDLALSPVGPQGPAGPAGSPLATPAPRPSARSTSQSPAERLIVRNGYLSLLVESVATVADEVGRIALELGGFVVSSSRQGEGKAIDAQVTIRVPVERFDEALNRLKGLAVRVATETTSGQDVTQEYTDLQAQLRNLAAAEGQLQRILERAEKVDEVLQVYRELVNIRGQIEQVKGRVQYLERTAAMSAIVVDLRPASSPEPLVREGWSPAETLKDAVRRLTTLGQGLVSGLIWIGVLAPVWVAGLLVAILLGLAARRWVQAIRRGRRSAP